MLLKGIRISNYKSFANSNWVEFQQGLNLIIGGNNVGKTALLEALDQTRFRSKPHRNYTLAYGEPIHSESKVEVKGCLTGGEMKNLLLTIGRSHVPFPSVNPEPVLRALEGLTDESALPFQLYAINELTWTPNSQDGHLFGTDQASELWTVGSDLSSRKITVLGRTPNGKDSISHEVGNLLNRSLYVFKAERLNVARSSITQRQPLSRDASNLANCLLNLQSNTARFSKYIEAVSTIFPNIRSVSTETVSSSECEISLWPVDPATGRDDLRISLNESGSGVGQVLAILYVVMESSGPKIIVIDEPNSFLHPGAVKKLMEILAQFPHQYIVSTHAPEIITSTEPSTLQLVSIEGGKSSIERLTGHEVGQTKRLMASVGVRLSDLFASDLVIWVEGQTEEICFPLIIEAAQGKLPSGVSLNAVLHTGDFEGRKIRAQMAFEVYDRLSQSNALLPPAIAFCFDREGRSEKDMDDLRRRSRGLVRFLPRKMYENYLLYPSAICEILNDELVTAGGNPISEKEVRDWISNNGGKGAYVGASLEIGSERWLQEVHGSHLLSDLFDELSDTKLTFRKTTHSVALTKWLLERDRAALQELVDFVQSLLCSDQRKDGAILDAVQN